VGREVGGAGGELPGAALEGGVWGLGLAEGVQPIAERGVGGQGPGDEVGFDAVLDDFQDLPFAETGTGGVLARELKELGSAGPDDVNPDLLSGELDLCPVDEGFWRVRHGGGELVCGLEGHDRKA
jgi:hypothetical protein